VGLTKAGVSVQLQIITESGKDADAAWESKRDSVEVLRDGVRIAFHPDMQHNKNYSSLRQNAATIVAETLKALGL
jgi:hypothetical protein